MSNAQTTLKDWQYALPDFTGISPIDPERVALPLGYFAVSLDETEFLPPQNAEQGGGIVCHFTVIEQGEFAGRKSRTTVFLGDKGGNKSALMGLLLSIGANAQQLIAMRGAGIGPKTFKGANGEPKRAYIYSDGAGASGEKGVYNNYTFVPPERYQTGKASLAVNKNVNSQAQAAGAMGGPAPSFAGAPAAPALGGAAPGFGGTAAPPAMGGQAAPGFAGIPTPPQAGAVGGVAALGQNLGQQPATPGTGAATVAFQ